MNEFKTPSDHLSIGEFSRRARLSLKALRLYDALGLLLPARVDAKSGYRYYREDQLERARLIGLLRQLEMPLDRIAVVLELSGMEAAQQISQWWGEVESSNRYKRGLVRYLEITLLGQGGIMFEVKTRHIPEQKVATISRKLFQPELNIFIPEAIVKLREYISAEGLKAGEIDWVNYYGEITLDSDAIAEVCVPFEGTLEPTAEIAIRVEPAHYEAYVTLRKEQCVYPDVLQAYDAVSKWVKQNQKSNVLPRREVYWADWSNTLADQPAFDVAFPYA